MLSNVKASIEREKRRLELSALHLLEEMLSLEISLVVRRRGKRLIIAAALPSLRQLLRLGRVLSNELGELFIVHGSGWLLVVGR